MEPIATYRVQLRNGVGFDEVAALADYLAELGVSHVYLSPYLRAAEGSTHGYDVVDHSMVDPALGGDDAHARMCLALRAAGLGQVVDVVPNHMSIATRENEWWRDVLENGQASRFAPYFDVDWKHAPRRSAENRVLMPILGDHYGRVLEDGHARVAREGERFVLRIYDDHELPLAPESLAPLLSRAAEQVSSPRLAFLAESLDELPAPVVEDEVVSAIRHRDKTVVFEMLARELEDDADAARAVDGELARVNADVDLLDELLDHQSYRLAWWRSARHDLDYRRFFDISDLLGLRQSRPAVFDATHGLVLDFVRRGWVEGLRIDHPDGLYDPTGYFRRLRDAAPDAWIVAEKILEGDEALPDGWPIDGTTGYDFLAIVGALFTDAAGATAIERRYRELTGDDVPYEARVRGLKRVVLDELLAADVNRLSEHLLGVCEVRRRHRDYTREQLREVLRALLTLFPVYRTYVRAGEPLTDSDRHTLDAAFAALRAHRPDLDAELVGFLEALLRGEVEGEAEADFVARFQQLTGPTMAKGVEDTTFFVFAPLLSANEVGGSPAHPATSLDAFHQRMSERARRWPRAMLAASTHDTKRSEDARARIAALTEMPDAWHGALEQLEAVAARHRVGDLPDPRTADYVHQTLVGAWPLDGARLAEHLRKAMREAKQRTSWHRPDEAYEDAIIGWARALVADPDYVAALEAFLAGLIPAARVASLSQLLVRLTAPGVPDVYQGTELWHERLTDPDNRAAVDFGARRALLREVREMSAVQALERMDEGVPKLFVLHRALAARRAHADCFGRRAGYEPLPATGAHAEHVVAFARTGEGQARCVTVAPRLVARKGAGWGDTALTLPPGGYADALSGARWSGETTVPVAELLAGFPVALLVPG